MTRTQKVSIIALRVGFGWYFLYQGIRAFIDKEWTVATYIQDPQSFTGFYQLLTRPDIIAPLSFVIKIAFVVIGIFLIAGLFVRTVSFIGMLLMLFFYGVHFSYPYAQHRFYIIDDYAVFFLVFVFLFAIRAGEYLGLGTFFKFSRY